MWGMSFTLTRLTFLRSFRLRFLSRVWSGSNTAENSLKRTSRIRTLDAIWVQGYGWMVTEVEHEDG